MVHPSCSTLQFLPIIVWTWELLLLGERTAIGGEVGDLVFRPAPRSAIGPSERVFGSLGSKGGIKAPGASTPDVSAPVAAVGDVGKPPPRMPLAGAASAGLRGPAPSLRASDLVQVNLRDGRCVRGRFRGKAARNGRVLLIEVDSIRDRAGNELEVRPPDSFVPDRLIESVEHLAEREVPN